MPLWPVRLPTRLYLLKSQRGTICSRANAAPPRTRADTVQIRSLPNSAEPSPALSHLRGTRKIPADENSDDRNEQAAREGSLFF